MCRNLLLSVRWQYKSQDNSLHSNRLQRPRYFLRGRDAALSSYWLHLLYKFRSHRLYVSTNSIISLNAYFHVNCMYNILQQIAAQRQAHNNIILSLNASLTQTVSACSCAESATIFHQAEDASTPSGCLLCKERTAHRGTPDHHIHHIHHIHTSHHVNMTYLMLHS